MTQEIFTGNKSLYSNWQFVGAKTSHDEQFLKSRQFCLPWFWYWSSMRCQWIVKLLPIEYIALQMFMQVGKMLIFRKPVKITVTAVVFFLRLFYITEQFHPSYPLITNPSDLVYYCQVQHHQSAKTSIRPSRNYPPYEANSHSIAMQIVTYPRKKVVIP